MKGYIRNLPPNSRFGFIRATTGLDNIFLHADNYHGDWDTLVVNARSLMNDTIKVTFELEEGSKGPRAIKCSVISEQEYRKKN